MASNSVPPTTARVGRVRLRRAAIMAGPAAAAAAVLVVLTAQGAIAAQFSISGIPFTVTAKQLQGNGFEQYGGLDNMADGSPNAGDSGGQEVVVVSAIKDATLTDLCQSVNLGGINMVIRAGTGSTPVSAHDLVTDSSVISGDAGFKNIEIGGDASTFTKGDSKGPSGDFGQQADTVTIDNLRQTNYATTAATFKLPGLHLSFKNDGC
ncbi:DUF6230 family protein [Streptomyces sp. PTM05]|uniref:DUF6230 family protein n=1 Tax=Streptantibioticus parmotrematis TaxID=2873249 RepID=A0ABS7QMJ5_9ACTN|nr:DUF6230 family protein [Streptantibioticus parmotrematis]MBY8883620.1 DUF6230 family protein [Streptantibioticus parmotrematis]